MLERFSQDVKVKIRTESSENEFNEPIYTWSEIVMRGCLVRPEQSLDEPYNETRHEGHKVLYTVVIPKSYASVNLENAQFCVHDEWLDVVGAPQHQDKCPTNYSCVVQLEKSHG